jgi:hypothetical protein
MPTAPTERRVPVALVELAGPLLVSAADAVADAPVAQAHGEAPGVLAARTALVAGSARR